MSQVSTAEYFDAISPVPEFLSKKERRKIRKEKRATKRNNILRLTDIYPLTEGQQRTFDAFESNKNLILHGVAGTGKTFISLYLAIKAVFEGTAPKPVVIIRSVVPTRDMGYLPGSIKEKSAIYEQPYSAICSELVSGSQNMVTPYQTLKNKGFIEFSTTSYLRGLTFRNNTIIVDECQNMTFHELDSIITRMGEGCRVIFCGDFRQSDLWKEDEKRGLNRFMTVVSKMHSFDRIEFTKDDIVRSDVVKEYILAKLEEGIL